MPAMPNPTCELDENPNKFSNFLLQIAGNHVEEMDIIMKDHCYARPWNWKPENVYVKPVKRLFFAKSQNCASKDVTVHEDIIDVDGDDLESTFPYDLSKIRQAMDEFQRVANFIRTEDNDDWEEKIDKILWSKEQRKIFYKIVAILNKEKTARLSRMNSEHEPILRRSCLDSTAKRFRETLASTNWDWRITQWLHALLFDHLPQEYLAIYLDILQTIKQKIPQLVDKMIAVPPNSNSKGTSVTWETLGPLLKKSWDPVAPILNANKPKKLPGNPILIVVPHGVSNVMSSRQHRWISQLGMLGMVISVNSHLGTSSNRMTMMAALEQLVQASRAKIQDVRIDYAGRPIILVGFNSGAALACQVGQMEHVTAIVCLGFPYNTVDGRRGNPDDTLLDVRCPVMFVIGEKAVLSHVDDIEDFRERMLVPTSLVVVGSADDQLRIPSYKKISEKISQNMVDRCILDEIGDFVGGILLQPNPLPLRSLNSVNNHENRGVRRTEMSRKRRVSTSSSVDSEPQSPNMKKVRPHSPHATNNISGVHTNFLPKGTLVTLTGTASTQTSRKKVRSYGNRNYTDQASVSRVNQQNKDSSGGITLNIGSLASLAPVGPIRFEPSTISLQSSGAHKINHNTVKATNSFIKVAKNNQVNLGGHQNIAKIKMLLPTKKIQQRGPNNYKNSNSLSDNTDDSNLMNIINSSSTPSRSASSTITSGLSATLATLPSIHVPKNQISSGTLAGKTISSSSILFTPKSSTTSTTSTVTSTSTPPAKVSDILTSVNNGFRGFQQHEQKSPLATERSSTTIKTRSPRPKVSTAQNTPKSSPKLHGTKNPQTLASPVNNLISSPNNNTTASLDEGLENILDIPIIIAEEGENLNAFETLPQGPVNKLLIINNKPNDFEQLSSQPHRPNKIEQKSVVLNRGTTLKPTVKYTRIILTKKNDSEEKSSPVILTKTRRSNKQIIQMTETKSVVKKAQRDSNSV